MATKIFEWLYLGSLKDAEYDLTEEELKNWKFLNVLERDLHTSINQKEEIYIPILKKNPDTWKFELDWNKVIEAADMIEKLRIENPGKKILVHCGAGQERSPLVVQYYLVRHYRMSADHAFLMLKTLRPEIFRCDEASYW